MTSGGNLIVLNDSSRARGGATALAIESALGAAAAGWNVTFITQDINAPDPRLYENGVRLVLTAGDRVNSAPSVRSLREGLWNNAAKSALEKEIAQCDMSQTVFHVHNWAHFLSPSIFSALNNNLSRVVITPHDFFLSCGNGGQFNYQTNQACELVGNSSRCLLTTCDKRSRLHKYWRVGRLELLRRAMKPEVFNGRLNLIHPRQKPFLAGAGFDPAKMSVIRNPITPFSDVQVKAEKNNTILFVGRMSLEKGADLAARIAQETGKKIVFCGDGPLLPALKERFPKATYKGFCSRAELSATIQKARFLLMPSKLEPFGLVAIEAIWSGVPVVINQTAFLAQEIAQNNAGISLEFSNYKEVVRVIHKLFEEDNVVEKMSNCGFRNCGDLASTPAQWLDANLKSYEKILEENRA